VFDLSVIVAFFLMEIGLVVHLHLDTLESIIYWHWQFIDIKTIREDVLGTLLFVHSQPPLLNFVASVLSLGSGDLYGKFVVLNGVCAAITGFIVFKICQSYTKASIIAFTLAALYMVSPSVLLNTAYPFYPTLTSTGYALLIYGFFVSKTNVKLSSVLTVISIIWLTLLRGSFSLLHAVLVLVVYLSYLGTKVTLAREKVLIVIVALLPIFSVYTKNYLLYDFFGSSSWAPLNMAKGFRINHDFFPPPKDIKEMYPNIECKYRYSDVDYVVTKSTGHPNYNSCYFLEFAKLQKENIFLEYRILPHLRHIVGNTGQYFSLPDKYAYLSNRVKIDAYADLYNKMFLTITPRDHYEIRLLVVFLSAFAVVFAVTRRDWFVAMVVFVFLVHMITHVVTDGDEGRRFVFDIEFMFYIFASVVFSAIRSHDVLLKTSAD
jgi:hypothetical protein